jgi:hypothetical protein
MIYLHLDRKRDTKRANLAKAQGAKLKESKAKRPRQSAAENDGEFLGKTH